MIIAFSGIDGSGKTTISKMVFESLKCKDKKTKWVYLGDYSFVLRKLVSILHFIKGWHGRNRSEKNPFLVKKKPPFFLKIWVVISAIDSLCVFIKLRVLSLLGYVVVCDRYFYDKLIGFEYHGYSNTFFSALFLMTVPKPDMLFLLDVDELLAQSRETEGAHEFEFYVEIRNLYRGLARKLERDLLFVGDKSLDDIFIEVKKTINNRMLSLNIIRMLWILLVVFIFMWTVNPKILTSQVESLMLKKHFVGSSNLLNPPIGENWFTVRVGTDPVNVDIPFRGTVQSSGFSVFFPGDLHLTPSYYPVAFKIYAVKRGSADILLDSVRDNRHSSYRLDIGQNIELDGYRLEVIHAPNDARITDLKFYYNQNMSFVDYIYVKSLDYNKSAGAYIFYTVIILIFLFVPGMVVFELMGLGRYVDDRHALIFFPLISVVLLFVFEAVLILYGTHVFIDLFLWIFIFGMFACFSSRYFLRYIRNNYYAIFVASFVLLIVNLLQMHRDIAFNLNYIEPFIDALGYIPSYMSNGYFGYHADNTLQWSIARVFLNNLSIVSPETSKYFVDYDGMSFFTRSPLFPISATPILEYFGDSHFVYQRYLNILMSFFYVATYFVLRKQFDNRTARIALLLMMMSVSLTFMDINAEIYLKYFSLFPAMLAVLFVLDEKSKSSVSDLLPALLLTVATLIHPIGMFVVVGVLCYYLFQYGLSIGLLKKIYTPLIIPVLVYVAWSLFASYMRQTFGTGVNSIYLDAVSSFTVDSLLNRGLNFINVFIPDFLLVRHSSMFDEKFMINFSRYSIVYVVSPLLFFFLVKNVLNRELRKKFGGVLLLGISPLVLFLLLLKNYSFGGYVFIYIFSVPFLFAFTIYSIEKMYTLAQNVILFSFPCFMIYPMIQYSGVFREFRDLNIDASVVSELSVLAYVLILFLLYLELNVRGLDDSSLRSQPQ